MAPATLGARRTRRLRSYMCWHIRSSGWSHRTFRRVNVIYMRVIELGVVKEITSQIHRNSHISIMDIKSRLCVGEAGRPLLGSQLRKIRGEGVHPVPCSIRTFVRQGTVDRQEDLHVRARHGSLNAQYREQHIQGPGSVYKFSKVNKWMYRHVGVGPEFSPLSRARSRPQTNKRILNASAGWNVRLRAPTCIPSAPVENNAGQP